MFYEIQYSNPHVLYKGVYQSIQTTPLTLDKGQKCYGIGITVLVLRNQH